MLSLKKSGRIIARIEGEESELDGKYLYANQVDDGKGFKNIMLEDDEEFTICPDINPLNSNRVYISGPNGSGKSYVAGQYCRNYNRIYKKNKIILFSPHEDNAYEGVNNLIKIDLNDEMLYDTPMEIAKFSNCLIIFDDTDSLQNKKQQAWINAFQADVVKNGRKLQIGCVYLSHMLMNGPKTRELIAEASAVVLFPNAGSKYHINRFLKIYAGYEPKMIEAIFKLNSRWVCIGMNAPQYVLSQHVAFLLH